MQVNNANTGLRSKQHFKVLDGMRGVAALAVVVFHFMEIVYTDYTKNFIYHGFLAVDFFFCLSGFVIAYAYDERMKQLKPGPFFARRLIRLHPLVVIGTVLGLLTFLFDPFGSQAANYSAGKIALLFASGIFMIPMPAMSDRYFNLFGLNAPAWSLFWEYIANIVYALVLWRINKRWLLVLLAPAAIGIGLVAHREGSLVGGWSGGTFWDGGVRVCYSFLAGMVVYRFNWTIKNKLGFAGMGILLLPALLMPFSSYNWLTEPLVVLIYFPLLVALGAGTEPTAATNKICIFSGNISYPLYMTHYCALWMFGNYYANHHPSKGVLAVIVITGIVVLTVFAWLVMVIYDVPVRKYLNKRVKV